MAFRVCVFALLAAAAAVSGRPQGGQPEFRIDENGNTVDRFGNMYDVSVHPAKRRKVLKKFKLKL